MKTIELIVSPSGIANIETKGFAGSDCQQASQFLEKCLGTLRREELTAEFFQVQSRQQSSVTRG